MNHPKLSISNLSKLYTDLEVFSKINISVNPGEFVSILGPSGCGKSTLFHIIAGLEKPTTGTITVDGKSNKNLLGTSGYMLQKPLLLPWKTVEENIMLGLTIRHTPQQKAKHQAQELLKKFHLEKFAQHYPATLSGGMAQRVALLRTVSFNNSFLLMDEPFGALDALTRLDMQTWLLDIWQTFTSTILFITHDIREAIFLSDRIYILSHRPAKILQEVTVPLSRPRKREYLNKKTVGELEQKLEDILLHEQII